MTCSLSNHLEINQLECYEIIASTLRSKISNKTLGADGRSTDATDSDGIWLILPPLTHQEARRDARAVLRDLTDDGSANFCDG